MVGHLIGQLNNRRYGASLPIKGGNQNGKESKSVQILQKDKY